LIFILNIITVVIIITTNLQLKYMAPYSTNNDFPHNILVGEIILIRISITKNETYKDLHNL